MPIPREILDVERPTNSIVICYGKNKDLYAVRQRIGCRNDGGRHLPVNGPTIGHIIDGKYVPIPVQGPDDISLSPIDLKDWAGIVLCDRIFKPLQKELSAVYSQSDTMKIYSIAILRVCSRGIKDYELKEAYETSFLSELYPGVALSKNTVSTFLNDLGKTMSRIVQFMRNRTAAVNMDHHLLIDGTLKSDESKVNSLSDFSRKAKTKGTRDISVLFAFDLEEMEPVCSKGFPGNMLDATAYKTFMEENRITKGIIVGDKGFPESAAREHFEKNPELHYLNPVKRNSKFIGRHNMLDFTAILPGYEGITYRKEKCVGTSKWLYSYRDSHKAAKEESDWLRRAKKNGTYSLDVLREKQKSFGTIVLECDLDLPAEIAYKAYDKRWEIELVMRYYKSACEFDETRVQDDYSVIGSEFIDFLSTLLTFRLIKEFDKAGLLEEHTYKKLMAVLTRAKKARIDGESWQMVRINPSQEEILQKLELIPRPEEPPKKKRGRPAGSKNKRIQTPDAEPAKEPEKRRRGRPPGSKNKPKASTSTIQT
jgi:transposase